MGKTFRPEQRLVVSCSRTDEGDETERVALLEGDLDWERVTELTRVHGVSALVYGKVNEHEARVPDDVLERLRTQARHVAQRNLRMLGEVATLSAAFAEAGIRAIPYRGPVVAQLAYDNVGLRTFGDLDFLVPHEELPAARACLLERGYEPRYILPSTMELTPTQEWAYIRFARDYPFTHGSEPFEVELHWRVISQHFPTAIDLEMVWDRRETLTVAGTEVPVLSAEDRLLMLCVHGTRHEWERLQWICDVTEFLARYEVDWDALERRAGEHHCRRMVYLGLAVSRELHGTTLPAAVEEAIDADPVIADLTEHVCRNLFDHTGGWSTDLRRYQSRTLERKRDKAKLWLSWACKPDRGDIETVAFPKPLVPLYVVVRWLRFASAAVRRVRRDRRSTDERVEVT
ncbi:nucleotidyltransferase domain-containing protein [Natronobiforma cellulositropha]|uniref:nucleotidyltransferase domain-containing protein n=1 Tax=Natronobiforma cellulositropha TaxID=1679076 RepID=UPI0021D5C9ED|nr:nucleotidyltransferase family protein [Natronobiforma cellulositropha]